MSFVPIYDVRSRPSSLGTWPSPKSREASALPQTKRARPLKLDFEAVNYS